MTDFPALLRLLATQQVEFVVIGGMAAIAHGSARLTVDLHIVYRRSKVNIERLVAALAPIHPYLRRPIGTSVFLGCANRFAGLELLSALMEERAKKG